MKQPFNFKKTLISSLIGITMLSTASLGWAAYDTKALEKSTNSFITLGKTATAKKLSPAQIAHWLTAAKKRHDGLHAGLMSDPMAIAKFFIPQKMLATLPSQFNALMESEARDLTGTMEVRIATFEDSQTERIDYVLHTDDGKIYYLYFAEIPPVTLESGAKVKIAKGFKLQRSERASDLLIGNTKDLTVTQAAPNLALVESFGPQRTIVMVVNYQDRPNEKPWTIDQVKANVFTTVNNVYYESSYRQTTVVGDAVGWFTVPFNSNTGCDPLVDDMPAYAEAAATAAGVNFANYRRKVYIFPNAVNCSWGGYGSIGRWDNWSYAWINGSNGPRLMGHELGHNIGIYHSNYLNCGSSVNTGTCTTVTYGDYADSMGRGTTAHFNAYHKDRLGWLNYQNSPPIQTVTSNGTFTIAPYETFDTNVKALKIAKRVLSNGSTDYYYLEFRQPIGFDAELNCSTCDFTQGVVVHQGNSSNGNTNVILDFTPGDGNMRRVALLPGRSFTDPLAPNGGVTFAVNSISAAGANVTVTFGSTPPTCVRANQTMTINPTTTTYVAPGGSANYAISVRNNDSTACASSTFNLAATPPTGITSSLSAPALSVAPGGTGTSTLTVNTATSTPQGVYTVPVRSTSASVSTNVATVNANIGVQTTGTCVRNAPTITYTPNTTQTIQQNGSVTINYQIDNRDTSTCAASNFTLTTSTNNSLIKSGISNAAYTIAPGGNATGYMIIKASNVAVVGSTYSATVTAQNAQNNRSVSFTSNVLIGNPLHK